MARVIETYRGFRVPTPRGNARDPYGYVINDGSFGYLTGSKESVVDSWKRVVDRHCERDAQDRGYTRIVRSTLSEPLSCPRCGSIVADVDLHDRFHGSLDELGIQD
jgi:hypothetical protein